MSYRLEIAVPLRRDTPLGSIVPVMRDLIRALRVGRWSDGMPPAPRLQDGLWQYAETGVWFDTKSKTLTILVGDTGDLTDLAPVNGFCNAIAPMSRTGFHYRWSDLSTADHSRQGQDVVFGRTDADRLIETRRIRVERAMTVLTGGDPNYNYSLLRETLSGLVGVGGDHFTGWDVEHIDAQSLEAEVTGLGAGLS